MLLLSLLSVCSAPAQSAELLLSPGGVSIDGYDGDEQIMWTDWATECSCQVLDLPDDVQLPAQIEAIRVGFSGPAGRWDHEATTVAVGLKLLDAGAQPTKLPGIAEWDWPETWFEITVSSTHLAEIPMENLLPPSYPLAMKGGRLAVFVCGTNPDDALAWPHDEETGEGAGVVIDPDLPGSDSYLWVYPELHSLADLGIEGGYAIQAVATDARESAAFSLSSIDPAGTALGVIAELTLHGAGFADGMIATIGGLDLAGSVLVDEETLSGRSPSGLPVGLHDVRAVSADGEESLLTSVFEVTEGADSGAADGSATDAGTGVAGADTDGGCGGCSQVSTGRRGWLGPGLLLLLGLPWSRRRQAPSVSTRRPIY